MSTSSSSSPATRSFSWLRGWMGGGVNRVAQADRAKTDGEGVRGVASGFPSEPEDSSKMAFIGFCFFHRPLGTGGGARCWTEEAVRAGRMRVRLMSPRTGKRKTTHPTSGVWKVLTWPSLSKERSSAVLARCWSPNPLAGRTCSSPSDGSRVRRCRLPRRRCAICWLLCRRPCHSRSLELSTF